MNFPAVIDLGTNTFHLLIGDDNGNVIYKKRIHVLLGKDRKESGLISQDAIFRAVQAISEFKETISEYKAEPVIAVATEGFRSGTNSAELVDAIEENTGIKVEVISGKMEAELIYLGVRQTIKFTDQNILIMDVGGGSVEFIIADHKGIIEKHSFKTGASYLLQKIAPSDPIKTSEISAAIDYLEKKFEPLFKSINKHLPLMLVGSSGSFETFAEILAEKNNETAFLERTHSYEIPLRQFRSILEVILQSDRRQRMQIPGMLHMRVDMIVLASIMIDLIVRKGKFKTMMMSKFALKEGLLWAHFNRQTT